MTNANMKLIVLGVMCADSLELNDAKLDEGEHIVKRVVELSQLFDELRGKLRGIHFCTQDVTDNDFCNLQSTTKRCRTVLQQQQSALRG